MWKNELYDERNRDEKNINYFMLTIILLISFSACSKKDNSFPANGVLIIGDENNISQLLIVIRKLRKNEVFSVKKGSWKWKCLNFK